MKNGYQTGTESQICDFDVEHNGRMEPCGKMREQLQLQICIIYNVRLFDTVVFILFSVCVWCHAAGKLVVFLATFQARQARSCSK